MVECDKCLLSESLNGNGSSDLSDFISFGSVERVSLIKYFCHIVRDIAFGPMTR